LLLIASNKKDLATDYLILRLHERNIPFLRVNTEDFLSSWEVCFSIGNNSTDVMISKAGKEPLSVKNISGAYIRQPQMPELNIIDADKEFAEREVGETLKSLWRSIDESVWLNVPYRILRASNKPEQLTIAKSMGFNVPETYIGANYEEIRLFYKKCSGRMISKAVKHGFNYDGNSARVAATQIIDEPTLISLKEYAPIPMIFQEHIAKKHDIRVTVVGDIIFATAIDSQKHEKTKVDWRLSDCYKIPLNQYAISLPESIKDLCVEITKRFKLKYSAIDLILGSNGVYYFLELNPNGQWAWIEQMGIHKIRDAIIDELRIRKVGKV
jgi:glutathione synthase/RimK-type ligase-like ATP-grasp enzyme